MSLFYDFNENAVVEKVNMKWPVDDYVIPAGTPMSRDGIANDGNAIGILANEARVRFSYPLSVAKHIGKKEPKGNLDYTFQIITTGYVNRQEAESAYGEAYSDAAVSAMSGIVFMPNNNGGSSGEAPSWNELTDKPFGYGEVVVFDGEILEDHISGTQVRLRTKSALVVGKKYTVVFDGVTYSDLVAFDDGGTPTIGASYDDFNNNVGNYPFCISTEPEEYFEGELICLMTRADHTLTIRGYGVKPMEKKFMSDISITLHERDGNLYYDTNGAIPVYMDDMDSIWYQYETVKVLGNVQGWVSEIVWNNDYAEVHCGSSTLYTCEHTPK